MMDRLINFFTSLRLTVVCLAFGILLVFFGTLAQVDEGLYAAQGRWFRSFIVWWTPAGGGLKFPIFPGGYLIGGVLLINLVAAHFKRFKLTWSKAGIHLTHLGIIVLLLGQLATDLLSRESQVHFVEGETRHFTESSQRNELVFLTDSADLKSDDVVSIPESLLKPSAEIRQEKLPFTVRVRAYYVNSDLRQRAPMFDTNAPPATQGIGPQAVVTPMAESKDTDQRNTPSAILELVSPQGSMGTWLVSTIYTEPQAFEFNGRVWRVAMRPTRHYLPYSIQLLTTKNDVYAGTDIPKNFQSRVRIENPAIGENREVDIYMNNPLRYAGLTFYQYQMGRDELDANRGSSTLMVVRNPGWLTPYAGCVMVGAGMMIQFLMHLVGFVTKRRVA